MNATTKNSNSPATLADAQPVTAAMTEWEIALANNKLQAERDALFVHLARLAEFQKLRARNPKSKALLRFPEFIADAQEAAQ